MTMSSTKRSVFCFSLISLAAGCSTASVDWRTRAERTGFAETSRYDETVAYCRDLERHCPWVKIMSMGFTPLGRDMPVVVISREQAFTPAHAAKTGKAVILVVNGVHAGEIEGKDASLALMRDIAINRSQEHLLDHAILLVVPIFNIDGHERFGRYNRINQNGPTEMGWRCTAQNLNLNRDYMKADAPEMRALLSTYHEWLPHLWFDNHTTDGADFQYDVTFGAGSGPENAPSISQYVNEELHPYLMKSLAARGHVPQLFFDMRDPLDPGKGIETNFGFAPRFSTGYGAITNRPSILVETHMLKSYETRVRATYDLMLETLLLINRNPDKLIDAVRTADRETSQLAERRSTQVALTTTRPADSPGESISFKGYSMTMAQSEASGAQYPVWNHEQPAETPSKLHGDALPARTVTAPCGYIIGPQWTAAISRLRAHGLPLQHLTHATKLTVETYHFRDVHWKERPFEGHHEATFKADLVREERTYPTGSMIVLTNNPMGKLAMHLLEPMAPDSLVSWGFFDAIFEQREYFENYAMAPIADRMMKEDSKVRAEFESWQRENPADANNPRARLDFFFRHSPYWDTQKDNYPVGRLLELPHDIRNVAIESK